MTTDELSARLAKYPKGTVCYIGIGPFASIPKSVHYGNEHGWREDFVTIADAPLKRRPPRPK